jgi:GH15 family glucan-1,4-alpha-glucosidase
LPIADYGFLSDCRSAALVGGDGQVDWLCWPRFDSAAICALLLDSQAGCWWMRPVDDMISTQEYLPNSLILQTYFETDTGRVRVSDWLHLGSRQALCRLVEGIEGEVVMDTGCDARRGWGLDGVAVWAERLGYLVTEIGAEERIILDGFTLPTESLIQVDGELSAIRPRSLWKVKAGESYGFSLGYARPGPSNLRVSLRRTQEWWLDWAEDLVVPKEYGEMTRKSALVLKGLQYQPSGAIVAAATTSLPEEPGGARNWDYRYSWIRDAAFTIDALAGCGKYDMADSWLDWLTSLSMASGIDSIQIMYGIGGEKSLPESELPLQGYGGAKPVRIGNEAASQRQLDTYGELLDAMLLHRQVTSAPTSSRRAKFAQALTDVVCDYWQETDQGIWEARSAPRHYVHSKVMAWVTLDRVIKLAEIDPDQFDRRDVERWRAEAKVIHNQVLERGAPNGWFQMAYDLPLDDAANLMVGLVGFVDCKDPRYVQTVRRVQANLANKAGWIWRYRDFDDGIGGGEGSFTICTLWLVRALHAIGDHKASRELMEKVLEAASPLGLYAEQLDESNAHWGNYPQAFTHIALIQCAWALAEDQDSSHPAIDASKA